MCKFNLKLVRDQLVADGKITQEESETIRDRALAIGYIFALLGFIAGLAIGSAVW